MIGKSRVRFCLLVGRDRAGPDERMTGSRMTAVGAIEDANADFFSES
jgi:hypothetical protein